MCPRDESSDPAAYSRLRLRWLLIETIAEPAFLIGLVLFMRHVAAPALNQAPFQHAPLTFTAAVVLASCVAYIAVMAPIHYRLEHQLPARFGLTARTRSEAAGQVLRSLSADALPPVLIVVAILVLRASQVGVTALILILCGILFVKLIEGRRGHVLGLRARPADATPAVAALREFAGTQGIERLDVFLLEGARLGKTAVAAYQKVRAAPTVYVSDTMFGLLSPSELRAVLAHELGHHRGRHATRLRATLTVFQLAAFVAATATAARLAPDSRSAVEALATAPLMLLAMWLVAFLLAPALLALSRRQERRANRAALEMTNDPAAFISAMRKLAANNLSAGRPKWWEKLLFASHPSLDEAIAQASRYAAEKGLALNDERVD